MSEWFRINSETIQFQKSAVRYWHPEIISSQPLMLPPTSSQKWTLTGPGAMWMYAYAAALIAEAGHQYAVRLQGQIETKDDPSLGQCELYIDETSHSAVLKIDLQGVKLTEQAIIHLLDRQLNRIPANKFCELYISGQANGVAYAYAAYQAVQKGVSLICCMSSSDGLVVTYDRTQKLLGNRPEIPDWIKPHLLRKSAHPKIIGIIGDPNSGKSVFSLALNHDRGQRGYLGWRLDCDGASPTPDWYLALNKNDPEYAQRIRRENKVEWSPELEDRIAAKMRRLREFFDVAIADLPGGKHTSDATERIPPHREVIMKEVDAFILIERSDRPSEIFWREALAAHQLEHRLVAVLKSSDPKGPPDLKIDAISQGFIRGTIQGLDRSKTPTELVLGYSKGFDDLWKILLPENINSKR